MTYRPLPACVTVHGSEIEGLGLFATVKVSVVDILIGLDQVRADTRWGFKCHLHRVLQGGDRELGGGHGSHPETEIRVDFFGHEPFDDHL